MDLLCICTIYDFFSTPENWKDYIIPFLSPIIGFLGAFLIMYLQVQKQKKIEKEKENKKFQLTAEIIYNLNQGVDNKIDKWSDTIIEMKGYCNITKFHQLPFYSFETEVFQPITALGFDVFYEVSRVYLNVDELLVSDYWEEVSSVERKFSRLLEYQQKIVTSYDNRVKELNRETGRLFQLVILLEDGDFKNHFLEKLDDYKRKQQKYIDMENVKILIEDFKKVIVKDEFRGRVDIAMVQGINDARDSVNGIESLIKSFSKSVTNYVDVLDSLKSGINNYQVEMKVKILELWNINTEKSTK